MSTRSQIAFYGDKEQELKSWDALIYKHSDGYPEGVLPLLEKFCRAFDKQRGLSDAEYASAWYLIWLGKEREENLARYRKDSTAMPGFDFIGLGISKDLHGDIEYFYAVYPDRIEVHALTHSRYEFNNGKLQSEKEVGFKTSLDGYVFTLKQIVDLSTPTG